MKFKTSAELAVTLLIAAAFAFVAMLALSIFGVWHQVDYRSLDALRRAAAGYGYLPAGSSAICYLTISDQTYEEFNRGNLDRRKLARANRILKEMGSESVLYDLIFSRPTRAVSDSEFAASVRDNGKIFLPTGFALRTHKTEFDAEAMQLPEAGREIAQMPEFLSAARGTGHVSAPSEQDGVYRRFFLVIRRNEELIPALALAAFLDHAGLTMKDVEIVWGEALVIHGQNSALVGRDIRVPIDESGRAWIPYTGLWANDFEKMSLHRVLEDYESEEKRGNLMNFFEGRFVLVGDISTGIADAGATPLENDVPLVAIHAALLNAFLQGQFIDFWRPARVVVLLTGIFLALGFAASFQLTRVFHMAAGGIAVLLLGLWTAEYLRHTFFPLITAGTAFLFVYIGLAVGIQFRDYRQTLKIRQENALLHKELDIAARIQRQFLPQALPERPDIEIAAVNIQALNVGGDFYDVVEFDSGSVCILLGDVSGKGIPAALHMSGIMSSFRSIVATSGSRSPRELLLLLNDVLYRYSTRAVSAFATAVLAVIDTRAMSMHVARCGHELPLIWNPDTRQMRELKPSGVMLGIRPSSEIKGLMREETVPLAPGELVCLYSDGISEAANPAQQFYEVHRLREAMRSYGGGPAPEVLEAVLSDVRAFCQNAPQHDDITLLFARIKAG